MPKSKSKQAKQAKQIKQIEQIDMFDMKQNRITSVAVEDVIYKMYYQELRPPTASELEAHKSTFTADQIKRIISERDTDLPLYDAFTTNIYIIQKRNVYNRVIGGHYRFPDRLLIRSITERKEKLEDKLAKNPEKQSDPIFIKKLRKASLMVEFMNYFDIDVLFTTYLRVFYLYAPEIANQTYTCIRKSFMPHKAHLLPYYTKDEVIRLAMNNALIEIPYNTSYDDFKDSISDADFSMLCSTIQSNDVSAKILLDHQNYIIQNNSVGLIQYYTVQGAYFINQYMRQLTSYVYKNDYLEDIIDKMWRLVLGAPAFDNAYTLYRFISNDSYLRHLKVGDLFIEPGFTSTTRDPFYKTEAYSFGFILIKIKIPKDAKGVGLCLETLSHFAVEEEIILAPFTSLKLVAITDAGDYYHPNKDFVAEVKKGYIFEWVSNAEPDKDNKLKFPERPEYPEDTPTIDFLTIEKSNSITMREKTSHLISHYFDEMNRTKCKIGDKTFYVVGEYYNSAGAYKDMYAISTSEGFSLYSIYNGYLLFMIELSDEDGIAQMRVNYFSKYSELKRDTVMGDNNFINFLSNVAMYFDIPIVIIYADYFSCDHMEDNEKGASRAKHTHIHTHTHTKVSRTKTKKQEKCGLCKVFVRNMEGGALSMDAEHEMLLQTLDSDRRAKLLMAKRKQRGLTSADVIPKDKIDKKGLVFKGSTISTRDDDVDLEYTGGSYCIDFYRYLKYGVKRYEDTGTFNIELKPKFEYRELDKMKQSLTSSILRFNDRDEIYQIYMRAYLAGDKEDVSKHNLANFYIWMIEHKCYLMDILVAKFDRVYKNKNPFKKGYYILDAMTYVYNRNRKIAYSRHIKIDFDEDFQQLVLPKNDYRIVRSEEFMRRPRIMS